MNSYWCSIALFLAILVAGPVVADYQPLPSKSTPENVPVKVVWEHPSLAIEALTGTSQVTKISFSYDDADPELYVWVTPGVSSFVTIIQQDQVTSPKGSHVDLDLVVTAPAGTPEGKYEGTIHVRSGNRTLGRTLPITLLLEHPSPTEIPLGASLPTKDRIAYDPVYELSYLKDEVIVGLADDAREVDLIALVSELGGGFYGSARGIGFFQLVFPSVNDSALLDVIIDQLESSPITEFASRAWLYELTRTPDFGKDPEWFTDPEYPDVWDEAFPDGRNAYLEFTDFPSAWDFTTGDGVAKIAIIDDGFDADHEDLVENVGFVNLLNIGGKHGTAVAGTLAAVGNNKFGTTGAVWDANLALYATGVPFTELVNAFSVFAAIASAIDKGAKIINMSFGRELGSQIFLSTVNKPFESLLSKSKSGDILFVSAAGNDRSRDVKFTSPASLSAKYPNVISVTAIGKLPGVRYALSPWVLKGNLGAVDVAAPSYVYTTLPNDEYGPMNGTSFATPIVAGLAGLLLAQDDTLVGAELKDLIVRGAKEAGPKVLGQSFHVINAARSLELASRSPSTTVSIEFDVKPPFSGAPGVLRGSLKLVEKVTTVVDAELYDGDSRIGRTSSFWTQGNADGWAFFSSECQNWNGDVDFSSIKDGSLIGRFQITSEVPFEIDLSSSRVSIVDLTNCEGTSIVGTGIVTAISVNGTPVFP